MTGVSSPTWRVCLVTDVYPPDCGGSGWSTHALACVLRARAHEVSVVVVDPTRSDVGARNFDGVHVTEVGVKTARRNLRARLGAHDYTYAVLKGFLDQFLRTNPSIDIVHAQHLHSGPPSVAVGNALGRATLVTVRDYWPVCLHGTSWWGKAVCDGCTAHNLAGCMREYWRWPGPLSRAMAGWAATRLDARARGLAAAHQVLTVSRAVKDRVIGHLPGADLSVVPNIVDPADVERHATTERDDPRPPSYLLAAGKLQPTKGFDRLLTALADLPVSRRQPVLVAGDGPSRARLETQATDLGLPVTFLGWVDHQRLLALQRGAQAVLVPSAWDEPLSRVVLETMALGTPVIAWDRGGTREIIESGVSGWLVASPADLATALESLMSTGRRPQVSAAARARIRECFSPEAVYPRVAAAYRAALAKSGRTSHVS